MGGEEDAAEVEQGNRAESEAGEQKEELGADRPGRSSKAGGITPNAENAVPWAAQA